MPLFGGGTGFEGPLTNLFIKGYPPISGVAPLFMGSSERTDAEPTLFMQGPSSSEATLFVKFDSIASGSQTLYLWGNQNYGGTSDQSEIPLTIEGTSGVPFSTTNSLTVLGNDGDEDLTTTLFIESGPTPTGSGTLRFFTEGGNPTVSNPVLDDAGTSLFIRNEETFNSSTTLFVEKDFNTAQTTTLFLKSNNPSGVTTLYSSGIGVTTTSSDLLIKAPEVKSTSLFSRGYT